MRKALDTALLALAATFGLAGLTGCSDLGEPIPRIPHAEISTTSLDFGTVLVSGNATRSVVVGNSGNGDLRGFASVGCAGYSLEAGGGAFTVPPGGAHTVTVRYQPAAEGPSPCQLQLGADIPFVTLTAAGAFQAPGAQCVLSVASLDLGTTTVGTSRQASYRVRNPGTAAASLNVVSSCLDFAVIAGGGPSTLAPGDSLLVTVQFAPQSAGSSSCSIAHGPGCPDLPVNGTATTPTTVSFAADIAPILASLSPTRGCANCHAFRAQDDLVNVRAGAYSPNVYIKPFDLLNSVLYQKITGTGRFGQPMPQGTQGLPAVDANKFRSWILEGALNN